MDTRLWDEKIQNIISALENAGYDPYAQMRGFLLSGDRMELKMMGREYGLLAEGDTEMLSFQGTRYLGFERNI